MGTSRTLTAVGKGTAWLPVPLTSEGLVRRVALPMTSAASRLASLGRCAQAEAPSSHSEAIPSRQLKCQFVSEKLDIPHQLSHEALAKANVHSLPIPTCFIILPAVQEYAKSILGDGL